METFFWSLALAAISGLTFVAYKHPLGFARNIFPPLAALTLLVLLFSIAGYMGAMNSLTGTLTEQVAPMKASSPVLFAVAKRIAEHFALLTTAVGLAAIILLYLVLLRYLPSILATSSEKPSPPQKDGDA